MDQDEGFQQPSESDLAALASQMPSFEMLESTTPITDDSPAPEETAQQDDAEGSFEFNLFSRSTVSKVDLKQDQTPAYAVTVRPSSYYSHTPTPQQVEEFRQAAIDYDMIVAQSQIPWPFCRRPEREIHLARDGTRIGASKNEKKTTTTRWRPSKARRRKFQELKAAEAARQERLARMKKTSWRTGPTKPKASADAGAKTARKPPAAKSGPAGGYPRKGAPPV